MLAYKFSNLLLYVPFNQEYLVPQTVRDALNKEEFFGKCYYQPKFDDEIAEIKKIPIESEPEFDLGYPGNKAEMISELQNHKNGEELFLDWISHNGTGVYCVSGDAGTGKSTFLHSIEYNNDKYNWNFLDLQKAVYEIRVMEYSFKLESFLNLHGKIQSVILTNIIDALFIKTDVFNYELTTKKIINLIEYYYENIDKLHPKREVSELYKKIKPLIALSYLSKKSFCKNCANIFNNYFQNICINMDAQNAFSILIDHYFILSRFLSSEKKHIIIFDNLERYIGTDEIFNDQIIEFFSWLRATCDEYDNQYKNIQSNTSKFTRCFQFVVAMRNTSIRMFTPQQHADFIPHKIDISNWFSINKIIEKKIDWYHNNVALLYYKKHPLEFKEEKEEFLDERLFERLKKILSDEGCTGEIIRGLRLKLNKLFNNDKRLITDFLISILQDDNNSKFLKYADSYFENDRVPENLRKFAYRAIMWRLILNNICQSALFQQALAHSSKEEVIAELDYSRKIITILSNHACGSNQTYMTFYELLSALYPNIHEIENWFYSDACSVERQKLAKALYTMNYCDRRENHWFQFVDIQCNSSALNRMHIVDSESFERCLFVPEVSRNIRIQITTSGKAYLGYVVHSFEFISCFYLQEPPLLGLLPTNEDLSRDDIDKLNCIKTVEKVIKQSKELCELAIKEAGTMHDIPYKKTASDKGTPYHIRIRNAHKGYLNNFCEFFEKYIDTPESYNKEKKAEAIAKLKTLSNSYNNIM